MEGSEINTMPMAGAMTEEVEHEAVMGASEEQKLYAKIQGLAMKIGLVAIVITFIVYLTGILHPWWAVDKISEVWGLKGEKYLEEIGVQKGWTWVSKLNYGDFLNFAPIAFLATTTAICYLAIIPSFIKKKDIIYAVLAGLEVIVLVLAASGIIPSGGH